MVERRRGENITSKLKALLRKGVTLEYMELFFPDVVELAEHLYDAFPFDYIRNPNRNTVLVNVLQSIGQVTSMFNRLKIENFDDKPVRIEGDMAEQVKLELFSYCIEDLKVDNGEGIIVNQPRMRADRMKSYLELL